MTEDEKFTLLGRDVTLGLLLFTLFLSGLGWVRVANSRPYDSPPRRMQWLDAGGKPYREQFDTGGDVHLLSNIPDRPLSLLRGDDWGAQPAGHRRAGASNRPGSPVSHADVCRGGQLILSHSISEDDSDQGYTLNVAKSRMDRLNLRPFRDPMLDGRYPKMSVDWNNYVLSKDGFLERFPSHDRAGSTLPYPMHADALQACSQADLRIFFMGYLFQ